MLRLTHGFEPFWRPAMWAAQGQKATRFGGGAEALEPGLAAKAARRLPKTFA